MPKSSTKPKRSFSDVFSKYKTYDDSQGRGNVGEWRSSWQSITGEQAVAIVGERSPYEILDVTSTATRDDVKTAYRRRAKQCHPDHFPNDAEREKEFRDVLAAYEVLMASF